MELGFLSEEGGLLARETSDCIDDWDGGIVGGKEPLWLRPPPPLPQLECGTCRRDMVFVAQVYAPLDEPHAYHRDLYVFACSTCPVATCIRAQATEHDRVVGAAPRERGEWRLPAYEPPVFLARRFALEVESGSDEESQGEEDSEEEEEESTCSRRCEICGDPGKYRCGACKCIFYCGREHQVEHWRSGHKQECKERGDESLSQKELDRMASMGSEKRLTQLLQAKDKHFQRFVRKTKDNPQQVLRYHRWPENDSMVLWVSKKGRLAASPPPCKYCQGPRKFEFQLLPQLLNSFEDIMDFGTIVLYTCTSSCELGGEFGEEMTIRQQM